MPYIRFNIPKSLLMGAFLIAGFIATSWFPSGDDIATLTIRQLQAERDDLKEANRRLIIRNDVLERRSAELDTIDRQLSDLRGRGYYPSKLYLRFLQRRSRELNVDNQFILNVLKTESSFWSQLDGPFGEIGGFQILPETLQRYVCMIFDLPESEFRLKDYSDVRTNTEWAYVLFVDMRFKKKRLDWGDWNRGWGR